MRIIPFVLAGLLGPAAIATAQLAPVPPLASTSFADSDPGAIDVVPDAVPVRLLVGRSTLIDIGGPIARVSLTSSDIADALVTSPNQLLVHGKVPGTISMFVWDRAGAVRRYEVAVQRDLARLDEQVKQLFPGEPVQVRSNGRQVVLAGSVSSQEVAGRIASLAAGYVEKAEDVLSLLQVQETGTQQVLLRVRFAEVSRSALSELGASFFTSATGIENTLGRVTTQQFPAPSYSELQWSKADSDFGSPVTSASGEINFSDFLNLFLFSQRYDLGVVVRALQQRGLFQSLAEPNLVSESGKEASFLAGGEFPVPIAQGSGINAAITVEYKEFGIRLNFTPTVVGEDRVHLKVKPEVSTLDFGNAVVLNGFRIPALVTRRTETELELRHGQTFAIAGLMNNQIASTMQKVPGLGDIPILGYLFRSKAAQKDQTELVVMITPEILPMGSPGVTPNLPRTPETFLEPLPSDRTHPVPPPAFTTERMAPAATDPALAIAAPDAAAPAPTAVLSAEELQQHQQQLREEQARREAENARTSAAGPAADEREQVRLAREQARRDAEAAERARREEERALEEERKRAAAEQREQERLAREQARREAEEAERARREAERALAEEEKRIAAEQREQERLAREQARRDAEAAERARREAERALQEQEKQEAAARREQERLARELAQREAEEVERARREAERARQEEEQSTTAAPAATTPAGQVDREAEIRAVQEARRLAEEARAAEAAKRNTDDREEARRRALEEAAARLAEVEAEYQAEVGSGGDQ